MVEGPPKIVRLDPLACLDLLGQSSVGRVAATIGALPAIRTVRFAVADDSVVFRVHPGSRLRRAVNNAVVAFNTDHCDDLRRTGWSVVVQGLCAEIKNADRLDSLQSVCLAPWSDAEGRDVFMSIPIEEISGEAIHW